MVVIAQRGTGRSWKIRELNIESVDPSGGWTLRANG
jgi:hypothetical protein